MLEKSKRLTLTRRLLKTEWAAVTLFILIIFIAIQIVFLLTQTTTIGSQVDSHRDLTLLT